VPGRSSHRHKKTKYMTVQYFPKIDSNGVKLREFAVAVLLPDAYNTSKKWPLMMSVHGVGEKGNGSQAVLENLVLGSLQPDGSRKWPFVTADMNIAVDKYGIVMLIPNYDTFFEPDQVNRVYDFALSTFSTVSEMLLNGFSLGGGAVVKYATSNLTNANRLAYAIPCAPVQGVIDPTIPGKANLPMHLFVNVYDTNGATNLTVTKSIVNAINATNPALKVLYTAFNLTGHGGFSEAVTIAPPKAPGGQGFTDAGENIYEVYLDILKNGPRQMRPVGGTVPPPTTQPPTTVVTPVTSYTIDATGIHLRGDQSIGYTSGLDGAWRMISGPPGATVYNVFPGGSTYINADGKLPIAGAYIFEFSLRGASPVRVTVAYPPGGSIKVLVSFSSVTDLITYSDGSTEKGTAVYSAGKWVVKTESGQIVSL
jgi:hypothetical protein